nr:uncharacterized protein LOC119181672 [Rhipicephalus microplus]
MAAGKAAGLLIGLLVLVRATQSAENTDGTISSREESHPPWNVGSPRETMACVAEKANWCRGSHDEAECKQRWFRFCHERPFTYLTYNNTSYEQRCHMCEREIKKKAEATPNGKMFRLLGTAMLPNYPNFFSVASTDPLDKGICESYFWMGCLQCDLDNGYFWHFYRQDIYVRNVKRNSDLIIFGLYPNGTFDFIKRGVEPKDWPQWNGHYQLIQERANCFTAQRILNGEPTFRRAFVSDYLDPGSKIVCAKRIQQNDKLYYMCEP